MKQQIKQNSKNSIVETDIMDMIVEIELCITSM